jgi:hypothetical protein
MVMLYPMYRIASLDEHIETLRRFKEVSPPAEVLRSATHGRAS